MESEYLPCHEADSFYYCGLNNLLPWEDSPCDSIGTIARRVCAQISAFVNNIVYDPGVAFDVGNEGIQQLGRCKKFQVRFLINVPVAWTPAKRLVVAAYTIHCWL